MIFKIFTQNPLMMASVCETNMTDIPNLQIRELQSDISTNKEILYI